MGAVSLEPLGIVFAVTFYADVVHEVAPLLLEKVFTALNTIEK